MLAAAIPDERAARNPAGAAIADERQELDNARFAQTVSAVAALLADAGLRRGGVLAVMLARWVSPYNRAKDQPVLNTVLMAAILAGMIHYFPSRAELGDRVAEQFPVGAVQYLNAHDVPEPMLNSYRFGGYLAWARGPEHKIFIDGRSELYETGGLLNDHMQLLEAKPAALSVLRFYGIKSLILEHSDSLIAMVSALPDWQKVYSDDLSVIFVHREPTTAVTAPEINRPTGRD